MPDEQPSITARHRNSPGPGRGAAADSPWVKVPTVAAAFWVVKALTTAFGESGSDWMVHAMPPVLAVLIGFVFFGCALGVQLRATTYAAWRYWLAVAAVGLFGTMAADVLHVGFHVPYVASAVLFAVALAAVFLGWYRVEGTLAMHSISTRRRELFYWAAVVATFALGTAVGDLAATTLGLGYGPSAVVFLVAIVVPVLGWRLLAWNPIATFWAAYVLTRPVGASVADWLGKPPSAGGVGVGSGIVAGLIGVLIVGLVWWLQRTGADAPSVRGITSDSASGGRDPIIRSR